MNSITKVVTINDETVEIPRLTLADLFTLGDYIVSEREIAARQLAKEEKIDTYETLNLVLELRSRKPSVNEILSLSASAQGAHKILEKSLKKATLTPDKVTKFLNEISIPDAVDLARMLVLDIQDAPIVKEDKEDKKEVPQETSPLEVAEVSSTGQEPVKKPSKQKASALEKVAYYGQKNENAEEVSK